MIHGDEHSEAGDGVVSQFEKNRFFEGKLMTARDMQTEQTYHTERLELLTRHTTGSGIVHGLEVSKIQDNGETIDVSVESGLAIDDYGRPIVVENATTKSLPAPDGTTLSLYVRFDEVSLESVPVPDANSPTTETEANHLVEVFELTYQETEPELREAIPTVDLDLDAAAGEPEAVGRQLAAAYRESQQPPEQSTDDASVYIGAFEQTPTGAWIRSETAPQPQYVYDHEQLYATLIEHIADTDNPHQTTTSATQSEPNLDIEEVEGITDKVDYLQSELAELKQQQQTANTHLMRKTLETTARLFRETAAQFAEHSGSVTKTAQEIADKAASASRTGVYTDPDRYLATVRDQLSLLVELGEQLNTVAGEATIERYLEAVAGLQSALETAQPAFEVAIALDRVAEAAVDLEVLYSVIPDE